jgi:hypothetical protein
LIQVDVGQPDQVRFHDVCLIQALPSRQPRRRPCHQGVRSFGGADKPKRISDYSAKPSMGEIPDPAAVRSLTLLAERSRACRALHAFFTRRSGGGGDAKSSVRSAMSIATHARPVSTAEDARRVRRPRAQQRHKAERLCQIRLRQPCRTLLRPNQNHTREARSVGLDGRTPTRNTVAAATSKMRPARPLHAAWS